MKVYKEKAANLKIAYIGGGSRGWAWGLMSDLAMEDALSGEVCLYDIDRDAAYANEKIGNSLSSVEGVKGNWRYTVSETLDGALRGADFVVISILPGTFDEMESDVHAPEAYGIYQSVGDTVGPAGIIRALRAMPMYEQFARAIEQNCPDAWVITYTNPMSLCVKALYDTFPRIKAFGCCHEVFGTQRVLAAIAAQALGVGEIPRDAISCNVTGINHFTWLTKAEYDGADLFPIYRDYIKSHPHGYPRPADWLDSTFHCLEKVKFDLLARYGAIAAAGDRHLAEFCPGSWYLKNPETVREWGFGLTPVSWRKADLQERLMRSKRLLSGEEAFALRETGEDGVKQIKALLGLSSFVTNVNLPNIGQVPDLPHGCIVETNAHFSRNSVTPLITDTMPAGVHALVSRNAYNQQLTTATVKSRDLSHAFQAFINDPLVNLTLSDSKALFAQMLRNTAAYLPDYNLSDWT